MFLYQIWSGLGRGYSEICLKATFVCRMLPQGLFFLKKYTFLEFWTWQILQKCFFCQKLDVWGHKLSKIGRPVSKQAKQYVFVFLLTSHPIFDNLWSQKSSFWQKTNFLRICHVQHYRNVSFFRKKKPLRERPTDKSSLKVIFWGFDMSKILEMCHFSRKKSLRELPTDKGSFSELTSTK